MTKFLSDKFKVLSFISIILVLYIHSGFHDYPNEIQGMVFNTNLQNFISGMIGRCAVPLFYAISGYLFFTGLYDGGNANYPKLWFKIKKRGKTLLVPYIIACLFPVVFNLVLEFIPGIEQFVNNKGISKNFHQPIDKILNFIYFDSGNGSPYAFHLWFLRDLIFIVVLSPILLYASEKTSKYAVCGILFVLNYFAIPFLPLSGMFWFMFGYCFLDKLSNLKSIFIPVIFTVLCITEILYDKFCPKDFEIKKHNVLMKACGFTFFIYLFHEPTLNIIRKILIIPFHHSSFGFAFSYLASPWIFAVIWIIIGIGFKRIMPHIYSICLGGR